MNIDFSIHRQTAMVLVTMDVNFATAIPVALCNYSVMKLVIAHVKIIQSDGDAIRVH